MGKDATPLGKITHSGPQGDEFFECLRFLSLRYLFIGLRRKF